MHKQMMNKYFFWKPILAGLGAMFCITALASLGDLFGFGFWLMAPFGASMVLVFGLPESPLAQPRNIVLGHLLTAVIGLLVVSYMDVNSWTLGMAVGLAVALMILSQTTHPPAGANPLLIMLTGQGWEFLLIPVALGSVVIVIFALVYNRVICGKNYPLRWF